jgi:predicted Zn-dependent protease
MSENDEVRISRDFRKEARKRLKLVRHVEIEHFVDRMGQRILSAMGPQPYDYRFFVVENRDLNAFAVPGGSIYLHTGLIERVTSTDELAAVVSHEIVHVKSRHMARLSRFDPTNLLGLLGMLLSVAGPSGQAAGALGQAIAASRQLAYNRKVEQEADTLGIKYMAEAGYDPRAALSFLRIINQENVLNPVEIPPYLRTHPVSQDRIGMMDAAIGSFRLQRPTYKPRDGIRKIQLILRLERHNSSAIVADLERRHGLDPENAEPVHLLAFTYHYKGDLLLARKNYERARKLNPKSHGIDRDLGRLYTEMDEFRLAHKAFQRSLKRDAENALTYLFLGELMEKKSRPREAVSAYLKARHISPLWAEPARRLGVTYGKMNRLGDAYYYLSQYHLLLDEDERAIHALDRALKELGPGSPRAQVIEGELQAIKERQ